MLLVFTQIQPVNNALSTKLLRPLGGEDICLTEFTYEVAIVVDSWATLQKQGKRFSFDSPRFLRGEFNL